MAKSKAEIQKEYNEALKVSQSLTGALNKMIDNTEKSQKKVSDAQKEFNNRLKSINGSATDYESTQDAILALEKQKAGLSKRYFGANKKLLPQKQKEVQANIDILSSEAERVKLVNELDSNAHSLANSLNGSLDGLLSGLDEIPGIGKGLSKLASGPINNLKGAFSDSAKVFTTKFSSALANGKGGMAAFAKAGGASMKVLSGFLLSPVGAIAALTAVLAIGLKAFVEMEKGAKAFRDETGLLNSQMDGMDTTINSVYMETVGLGASMEDVGKNAAAFVKEFGGIEKPSENVIKSLTVMNKNFGVAVGDAAKVNKAFQNMGGLSADVAQANAESVVSLAQQNGVAPSKVMADIADSAEEAQGFFRGNIQALGAAAINAAKMGSSLKEAAKVSRGLLNYQDSVTSEMEASAILGTNLNFSQSRYLAATGDVVGAQASMVKQLRNRVDLDKASVFEIEAMEKATGMQFSQIQNMARLQKLNLGLDKDRNKVLQEAIKGGLDISKMSGDEIKAKTEVLALQKETQTRIGAMSDTLKGFGAKLTQMFLPIGEFLVGGLESAMPVISTVFNAISKGISAIGSFAKSIFKVFSKIFKEAISPLASELKEPFEAVQPIISSMFGGMMKGFKVLGSFAKSTLLPVFSVLGKVLKIAFMPITAAVTVIKSMYALVSALVTDGLGGFISKAQEMGPLLSGISATVGIIAAAWVVSIVPSIIAAGVGLVTTMVPALIAGAGSLVTMAGAAIGWAISMATGAIAAISAASAATLGIGALAIAGGIAVAAVAMNSATADAEKSIPAPAVEDGIVKDRQIVSTHPDDYLIATKDPGGLASAMSGGGMDMSGVIAELKELKAAFVANKDVYIDNEKITSRISKTQEKSNINQFGIMGA